jgi:hypothetical protein
MSAVTLEPIDVPSTWSIPSALANRAFERAEVLPELADESCTAAISVAAALAVHRCNVATVATRTRALRSEGLTKERGGDRRREGLWRRPRLANQRGASAVRRWRKCRRFIASVATSFPSPA